ncbi:MAG: DUF2062 domain-containing protein [Candidatus Auribacterota bacterium]|jgi:uncharacterized protein (DUF2062 family)|nr:DUF2062 domain-containing protein [Candidatus Auribacterota bacterium]
MRTWFKFWRKRQLFIKRDLKKTRLFKILGHRIFSKMLWKIDKSAIAGGLSLGLFIAFMPTLGFQMILAALGAILLKVNLPIALVACWVTNPLTVIPIYTAEWRLGKLILEDFTAIRVVFDLYAVEGRTVKIIMHGLYLWTGSLVFSLASALTANVAVRTLWMISEYIQKPDFIKKNRIRKQE